MVIMILGSKYHLFGTGTLVDLMLKTVVTVEH